MSDLISRQAAMKEFSDYVRASNNSDFARTPTWNDAVSLVGSMPSAQPEKRTEERTKTHSCDCIERQAAIDALDKRFDSIPMEQTTEILQLRKDLRDLPSALRWIPCSERLPGDDEEVIVSCTDDSGDYDFDYTTVGWHYKGLWVVNNERSYFVRAWMPLPEPWKGRQDE